MLTQAAQIATNILGRQGRHPLRRVAPRVRRAILARQDPEVTFTVGGRALRLPLSHELPITVAYAPTYNANVTAIASAIVATHGRFPAIDIGANVGDTAALMLDAEPSLPILAVEGEQRFVSFLERNLGGLENVHVTSAWLDEAAGPVEARKQYERGTEELVVGAGGDLITMQTLDTLLDAWPEFRHAKLLKVDTDGFDCRVLRGATALLTEAHPVVMFEFDIGMLDRSDPAGLRIFEHLARFGYANAVIFDNTGRYMTTMPVEDGPAITALARWFADRGYIDCCVIHQADPAITDCLRDIYAR